MFHNNIPPNFYSINYTTNIQSSQHLISKNLLFVIAVVPLGHVCVLRACAFASDSDTNGNDRADKRCADENVN
jgi:hypothetical protein